MPGSAHSGAQRLSIVVPVLDEAAVIETGLAALADLRSRGHEVIVVDGGSRDASAALAAPLCDRVITTARGRAAQMNAGARVARGDVLVFLHCDTRLPPAADRLIGTALETHRWGRFDVRIGGRAQLLRVVAWMMNRRSRLTGIATGDQAMFVRRDEFAAVGGFPEQPLMEDIELSDRLRRRGAPACLRERVLTSGRRWESRGVLPTIVLMWWLRLAYALGVDAHRIARWYR